MKNDELSLYIDGEWCRGTDGAADVVDPATEESLGRLSFAGKVDIDRALTSAEQGFREWSKRLPQQRAAVLHRVAALVAERADEIGRNLTQEQGKPLGEARNELLRVAESFRWCAEEATRIWGKVWPIRRAGTRHMTIKVPSGLVAAFTPWNFPATIPGRKLSAALAGSREFSVRRSTGGCGAAVVVTGRAQRLGDRFGCRGKSSGGAGRKAFVASDTRAWRPCAGHCV